MKKISAYRKTFSEALQQVREPINEFKKMTVTFKSMADMSKALTDLAKQGFTIDAKGMVMKVDGKGADLNKYATDLKNFYHASVRAESYAIDESADEDNYDPITEACWVGWTQRGMKMKGGKQVPNCVKEEMTNEELEQDYNENVDDYFKSKLDAKQIQNLKTVWSRKNASDITPAIKKMLKAMDVPTQLAIKHANINQISKLIEENEDLIDENFSKAQLDKLAKEYESLRGKRISMDNANKLRKMFDKIPDSALKDLKNKKIPFLSAMALSRMVQKGMKLEDWVPAYEDVINEGTGTITNFRNDREVTNMMSLAKQHGVTATLVGSGAGAKVMLKGNMRKILDMQLAAQRNGLKAEEILFVEVKEEEELPKKVAKKNEPDQIADTETKKEGGDAEKLKSELEKKDAEINALKTKAETEKAKVAKKETEKLVNPETGEPLLQVGIAYKHLKDKMMKQKEAVKEMWEENLNEFSTQQIKMAYGILNDPRYKQGNYSGAVKAIEKLATGLSKHKDVANALKRANEAYENMSKDKAYAIGMSTAKKKFNDEKPLEKSTIKKGHEIADKLLGKKEDLDAQPQDKDVKSKDGTQPKKYYKNLSKDTKDSRANHFAKKDTTKNDNSPAPGDKDAETKPSQFTQKYKKMYGEGKMSQIDAMQKDGKSSSEIAKLMKLPLRVVKSILGEHVEHPAKQMFEQIEGLKNKAEKSGMSYGILKKVYDRGMAAWRGGHRPGTTQQQWAFARVNSFITKSSGTWGGADKDLAAKVKGESLEEASLYAFKEYEPSQSYEASRDMKNVEDAIKRAGGRIKSKEKPTQREPNASFEIETGNPNAVKAAIKKADPEFNVD